MKLIKFLILLIFKYFIIRIRIKHIKIMKIITFKVLRLILRFNLNLYIDLRINLE